MTHDEVDRRNFNRLTAAALGGMLTGFISGCGSRNEPAQSAASPAPGPIGGEEANSAAGALAAADKHLCRGLNDCKGLGVGGDNACRGQGQCATYEHHACAGENSCKGQGGCGENPGQNACKGQGGCHVPLMESAWEQVRAREEQEWKAANQEFAEAPPAKE
jgi:hypothetical protein